MTKLTYIMLNEAKNTYNNRNVSILLYNKQIINSLYCSIISTIDNGFTLCATFRNDSKIFLIQNHTVKKKINRGYFQISFDNQEFNSVANWAIRRGSLKKIW